MNKLNIEREMKPRKKAAKALAGFMVIMVFLTLGSRMLESFTMAEVTITRASGGSIERVLETNGTIRISNDEPVKAGDALTVLKVHVRNGDMIEAGAPLVTVDIDLLKEKLAQAQIDLRRKELAMQSVNFPTVGITPEEMLANALRVRDDVGQTVSESEINADLALVQAENALLLNKKLLERSITNSLVSAEEALTLAQENWTERINTAQKAYVKAQTAYNEFYKADTGTLALKKIDAYDAYTSSELALSDAVAAQSAANSAENDKVIDAQADVVTAQALVNTKAAEDPVDAAALAAAQAALVTANAALQASQTHRTLVSQQQSAAVSRALRERNKAYVYYDGVFKQTAPEILSLIEDVQETLANTKIAYDKAVKDGNSAVTAVQEKLENTRRTKTLWQMGTLVSNDERTPAEIESALKSVEAAADALVSAQKNREKVLKQNNRTIEDADKTLNKAREDAARQTKTNRISEETRKLDKIAAETELEKNRNSVERLMKLVDTKGIINAPIAGTVSEVIVSEGAAIAEGAVIARIAAGEKSMKIIATVTANEAKQLKAGLEAELYSDRIWAMGKVAEVRKASGTGGQTGGQTMYEVHISINPGQGDFVVGDSVRITIRQTSQRYNTLIPLSALREDADGKFVFVLEEQSGALGTKQIVRRIDVTVQESNLTQAAVSGAFSDWEKLVDRGDRELKNGDRVRIKQ